MPSTSRAVRPASRIARRIASTAIARVVRPEAREYSVSPTPTTQYWSRRVFIAPPCRARAPSRAILAGPRSARRLRAHEEDDRADVQERREQPREVVAPGRVVDRARDERSPPCHHPGQREEEPDELARLAAAEEVADDRGEERGDRAVRVAEDERAAEEQGEAAIGEEEAEEADGLERHRDPDGGLAPDPVRDRAHDEAAGDGADAERRHQELGHGWQHDGPDARAARREADRDAAPRDEPFHDRRVAWHVRGGHAERRHETVQQVRLPELGDERHAGERRTEEDPTGGDHDARAPEVGESPGRKAEDAVGEGVDGERAGEARAAPAELLEEGAEEDAERVLGTVGDEEDEERARDDDPAVENFQA